MLHMQHEFVRALSVVDGKVGGNGSAPRDHRAWNRNQWARCPDGLALHILFNKVSAITDGVAATATPASLNAAIFAAAVPLPPLTIAPAWPIRRPGGAVAPAIKPATGFLQWCLIHSAASSSALPPISPIRMMPRVSGSSLNSLITSRWEVPLTGSPPMPTQVLWPTPRQVSCQTAS